MPSRDPSHYQSPQHVLLGLGTAVSLLGDSTLYTVLPRPEIAEQAGVTLAAVGVLLGANRAVRLLTNGVAGLLYDRYPRRGLLVGALGIGALSTVLLAVGRGFLPLLIARLLWGAAWSGIWVGSNAVVLDMTGPGNRGRVIGQYQLWYFLGGGATALAGGLLTDALGYHNGLLVSAGVTAVLALLWLVYLPRSGPSGGRVQISMPRVPADPIPWRAALSAAIPLFATRFVFSGAISATTILWLEHQIGDQVMRGSLVVPIATLTGGLVALRAAGSVVGAPLAGRLSDRRGGRWPVLAWVMAVSAAGVWVMSSPNLALALLGSLVAWVAASGAQSLVAAIVGDSCRPAQRGRVLGAVYSGGDLGSALGPPVALALILAIPVGTLYQLCSGLLLVVALYAILEARANRTGVESAPQTELDGRNG